MAKKQSSVGGFGERVTIKDTSTLKIIKKNKSSQDNKQK